ncbi:PAS domain S-box protein, partial [candidate division KSB1 bacterium]
MQKEVMSKPSYKNLTEKVRELEKKLTEFDKDPLTSFDKAGAVIYEHLKSSRHEKIVREALRKSEERYRNLVETSHDLIFRMDNEYRFTYLNKAWEKTHGYKTDDMINKKFWDFQKTETAKKDKKYLPEDLIQGIVKGYETTHISNSGNEIYLRINLMLLLDDEWKIIGSQGTANDITEYKHAERALKNSENKYRAIFENIRDVYYEISCTGKILEVSPSIEDNFGYERQNVLGENIKLLFQNVEDYNSFMSKLNNDNCLYDYEISIIDADGKERICSVNASKVTENSSGCKFVGLMRDISVRKTAETEKLQKEKFQGVLELAGAACHELNQPLQAILGFAQMLSMNIPSKISSSEFIK